MKRVLSFLLIGVVLFSSMNIGFASEKENSYVINQDLDKVRQRFEEQNINEKDIDKLIQKIESGETLDIFNPNKKPEEIKKVLNGDDIYITYIYSDNSRATASITGGKRTLTSYTDSWEGRTVKYTSALLEFSYKVDYCLVKDGCGNDAITSVYDYHVLLFAGSYSNANLRIVKEEESSSKPAEGRLSINLQVPSHPSSGTKSLSVFVGNNTAYARVNDYY